jgi:porin
LRRPLLSLAALVCLALPLGGQQLVAAFQPLPAPTADPVAGTTEQVDASTDATAEAQGADREWFGGAPLGGWSRATGDWNGLRAGLAERGITIEGSLVSDLSRVARGGLASRATGRALLSAGLGLDLDAAIGVPGGSAYFGFYRYRGREGSQDAGDIQAYSNIDADRFSHLSEAWYEQRLFADRLRVKVGRVDANTEYAVAGAAGGFLNASAGFSPTIYALPTYPEPTASANLFVSPTSWFTFGAGFYHGTLGDVTLPGYAHQSDLFAIVEAGGSWGKQTPGRIAVGRWSHSGLAPTFDGGAVDGTAGWYGLVEQRLTGHGETDSVAASGWSAFLKYGRADDAVSEFGQHAMLGVVREAPLGWEAASTGLMVSAVDLSDRSSAGFPVNETTLEGYVRFPLLGFLSIAPDAQYIVHPAGLRGVKDALVGTLRMEVSF